MKTANRACLRALLAEVRRRGGTITSGQAHRWLNARSSTPVPRAAARALLRQATARGELVQQDERGRRVFALSYAGGGTDA